MKVGSSEAALCHVAVPAEGTESDPEAALKTASGTEFIVTRVRGSDLVADTAANRESLGRRAEGRAYHLPEV